LVAKTETADIKSNKAVEWLKWLIVAVILASGIFCNWYFQEVWILWRALALVGAGVLIVLIGLTTERGHALWDLAREARLEIRRVVWPTRQETTQTTLIVLGLILLASLLLWALDSALSWLVRSLIG
jgi:preprotein translocase subunit SecE